ncbi:immunoglobulin domain-containing protein [Aquimarina sp. MMG016]|uniref:immunoglobulin domain-containing protein n=1 Tax=Aquimarina sp. MMG016 TaxID=2822690 RepID=UPI001B3A2F85|nr:immunoglobulin domain-containing protein [Aquimarina sp. MMG016]MBQ4818722.1 immunoglobulin domain-containing protein [Aquimarina sp. MMG016]
MKKLLLIAVMALTTFSYSQTNLIQNGSLEDWTLDQLNNWSLQEGNITQTQVEFTNGSSGALFVDGATTPKIVATNYTLEAGKTYELSFDYKVKNANTSFGQQVISYAYGATDLDPNNSSSRIPSDFNWNTVTQTITPTVTETWYFEISLASFIADPFEVYIDNIKIIDIAEATPERDALIAIYNATNGASWTNPWDLSEDHTTWDGVIVDANNKVTGLNLIARGLNGTLPEEIENLTELTSIQILNNPLLTGTIPTEIGNLSNLESLQLTNNGFSGNIPDEVGLLSQLTLLNLTGNNLSGTLTSSIPDLTNLETLNLSSNNFNGSLPTNLDNLSSLITLNLQNNSFSGTIPSNIGSISSLESLLLSSNDFDGDIPTTLGSLTNATEIDLSNNDFTGTIPSTFVNLTNMTDLQLSGNNLSGDLPTFIWSMTWLENIEIQSNRFTGSITADISNLTNLTTLNLGNNRLTGVLPSQLWSLTNLQYFNVENLSTLDPWSITADIANLISLVWFEAGNSRLTGTLPDVFDAFPNLERFRVENNDLSGSIPATMSTPTNLKIVTFQNNNFSGTIPGLSATGVSLYGIYNNSFVFEDLEAEYATYDSNVTSFIVSPQPNLDTEEDLVLDVGTNYTITVSGTSSPNNIYQWRRNGVNIPGEMGTSLSLTNLSASDSGAYDCVITNPNVSGLTLYRNTVTINIFSQAERDALLAIYNATDGPNWVNPWDLSKNINEWAGVILNSENEVIILSLKSRNLTGILPQELGDLVELTSIEVSDNNLSGDFPSSMSNLTKLESISASDNNYTGNLPDVFSNIPSLREILLQRNGFIGTLPTAYGNLTNLEQLNLQANDMSGGIPSSFQNLINLTLINLESNGGFTGTIDWITNLILLENINIEGNDFSGSIPDLSSITNLVNINLSRNALTGSPSNVFSNVNTRSIDISSNNFDPYQLPSSIGNLTQLRLLNLSNTNLEGALPNTFSGLTSLNSIILTNNNLEGEIPSSFSSIPTLNQVLLGNNNLSGIIPSIPTTNLTWFSIESNRFVFDDMEPTYSNYAVIGRYDYDNQQNVDTAETITLTEDDTFTVEVQATTSSNNRYQWRRNGVNISGATNSSYTINSVRLSDAGAYDCVITNTVVTDLSLLKEITTLQILIGDSDNDGVTNDIDICPNTSAGEIVDANGCSLDQALDIDNNDIQVIVTSTSCPGVPNGEVTISFEKDYTYTVTLTGNGENRTENNVSFSQDLILDNLAVGNYEVCITVPAFTNFEQCYTVVVEAPESLKTSEAKVDYDSKKATIEVSGSIYYKVLVNDNMYEFGFGDTGIKQVAITLENGLNNISVETDKICQGKFSETIMVNDLNIYPIPASDYLNIAGLGNFKNTEILITDITGNVVLSSSPKETETQIQLSISNLATGMYLVHITTSTQTITTKIYKK